MNPFQIKTVAAAIAPLLKVLKNLEAVVKASSAKITANDLLMERIEGESLAADAERASANQIIESLGGIVNYGPGSKE